MYQQTGGAGQQQDAGFGGQQQSQGSSNNGADDIQDADFEEVK